MTPLKQVGALPYVDTESGPFVLLITTRGRGRWTIPKGWVKAAVADAELAAREALEEAGITGEIDAEPIGTFTYTKRLHLFSWVRCNVDIYLLRATCQHLSWPEKESRRCHWVTPGAAADMVAEAGLSDILRGFPALLPPSGR